MLVSVGGVWVSTSSLMSRSAPSLLAIYMRDHHAAGCAGVAIAHRVAARLRQGSRSGALTEVAREIEADLRSLEALMASIGVESSQAKDVLARLAERVGRLKLNGHILRHSPLSAVVELDAGRWHHRQGSVVGEPSGRCVPPRGRASNVDRAGTGAERNSRGLPTCSRPPRLRFLQYRLATQVPRGDSQRVLSRAPRRIATPFARACVVLACRV